ncbi:MAG: cation-translocating P-type ATPase [Burkholderiales bacterium]|nr:cation-translocating P-type ATPase [Burkholderiales bacterium]
METLNISKNISSITGGDRINGQAKQKSVWLGNSITDKNDSAPTGLHQKEASNKESQSQTHHHEHEHQSVQTLNTHHDHHEEPAHSYQHEHQEKVALNEDADVTHVKHAHEESADNHDHDQHHHEDSHHHEDHHHHHGNHDHGCECHHDHDEEMENTLDTEWKIPRLNTKKQASIESSLKAIPGVKSISFEKGVIALTSTEDAVALIEKAFKEDHLKATRKIDSNKDTSQIRIEQMDCPTEESLIRKKLKSMEGVGGLQFNLMNRVLTVSYPHGKLEEVLEAIRSLDYDPELLKADEKPKLTEFKPTKIPWWKFGVGIALAAVSELAEYVGWPDAVSLVFALAAILTVGLGTYKKGLIAFKNFNFNMNALMTVAVTGAVLIGSWPEAAMVMVLFELSEAIEQLSLDKARGAIRSLLALAPETASVQQPDGSWKNVKADAIEVGNIIRVEPGERLAVDGVVVKGDTTINQAPITGESLPVEKGPGSQVFAGTVNENAEFEYKATSTAQNSMPARIISAIETAQSSRAPTQRFVDSFARIYTPLVFVIAIGTALIPPLDFPADCFSWIYKSLKLLVISCPCALVISTPVTVVTGLATAARRGILIKGGVYLEKGRKLKVVALDKTGTITEGRPKVQSYVALDPKSNPTEVLKVAATLAQRNSHPVSQAVALLAAEKIPGQTSEEVEGFHTVPGQGVYGQIKGQEWYLGNLKGLEKYGNSEATPNQDAIKITEKGYSPLFLAENGKPIAVFGIADQIKEHSKDAVKWLTKLGVDTVMLSGDNAKTAERVGKEVGIKSVKGNLLPEDKQTFIHELAQKKTVGMVGDGINDAPALARSDIGFAMGAAGTDTAIETADVALMDDDLRKLPAFVELSKATFSILCQNIFIALAVKLAFLILTYMGYATMWMAVFADTGVCLIVVANGLRLLGWKPSS